MGGLNFGIWARLRSQPRWLRRAGGMTAVSLILLLAVGMTGLLAGKAPGPSPPVQAAAPDPGASPEPADTTTAPDDTGGGGGGGYYQVGPPRACGAIAAPAYAPGPYPRIVVPRVGINVEIGEGDASTPPEGVWKAWHLRDTPQPGTAGNAFIYAHAHGTPRGSASGLFYPIHYLHVCDAIYVYMGPGRVFRYQVSAVNLRWPSGNDSPLVNTPDERITLQTCNTWNRKDPKVIIVAERVDLPPPPPPRAPVPQPAPGSGSQPEGPPPSTPPPPPVGRVPCLVHCGP